MKVVLDTNVFVSGIFWPGPPSQILDYWRNDHFRMVLSPEIFREYRLVAEDLSVHFPGLDYHRFLDLVVLHAEMINPFPLLHRVSSDPKDDKFIACAIDGAADYIVSGDRHLFSIVIHRGIHILKPRKFLDSVLLKHNRL